MSFSSMSSVLNDLGLKTSCCCLETVDWLGDNTLSSVKTPGGQMMFNRFSLWQAALSGVPPKKSSSIERNQQ